MSGPARPRAPRPPETPLHDGETVLHGWRPNLAVFAQRALLLGFVTALGLSGFGFIAWWQWLIAMPLLSLTYIFVFDDHTTWFRHRGDRWILTNMRLIYESSDSPEENAAIQLPDIIWMKPWFWWSLRLGFEGGTSTAIRFIRDPRGARKRIAAARTALTGGAA
jgi:hypothetical protein